MHKYEVITQELSSWQEKVRWYESEQRNYVHQIQVLQKQLEQGNLGIKQQISNEINQARQEEAKKYQI